MKRPTILVVDDEPRYVKLVRFNLQSSGYRALAAFDGASALKAAAAEELSLIILDIMLPDMDGYTVCRRVREFSTVPIIMLTAKGEETHKVQGLAAGADDYVTKPFGVEELLARVSAVLRRQEWERSPAQSDRLVIGGISLEYDQHKVMVRGKQGELSPTEFRLLDLLMQNAGRVLVPDLILRRVWGDGYEGDNQLLRTAIKRLRHKIELDPEHPCCITNHRGVGYSFAAPAE